MRKRMDQRGITLIEIIIVIGILGIVLAGTWPLMHYSNHAEAGVRDEYQIQSDMRIAAEELTARLRTATVGFTVSDTQLGTGRSAGWDYFVLEDHNRRIVFYHWQDTGGGVFAHVPTVIVPSRSGITYNLLFSQSAPGSKKVKFKLDGFVDGNDDLKMTVESEIIALNSIVIDDIGTAGSPAVALAYKSDPTPTPETVTTHKDVRVAVALVLDDSGSMGFTMGGTGSDRNQIRNTILEAKAKDMIDDFVDIGYASVCVIPYNEKARPKTMMDATDANRNTLKGYITALNPDEGTNTGDGMRRGYYALSDYRSAYRTAHPGAEVVCYLILLSDGNPTYYSQYWDNGSRSWKYQLSSGDMNTRGGDGGTTDSTCMNYTRDVGSNLIKSGGFEIKTFGIGFTGVASEVSRMQEITVTNCGGTYYSATSNVELEEVFQNITSTILRETWHIYGPY